MVVLLGIGGTAGKKTGLLSREGCIFLKKTLIFFKFWLCWVFVVAQAFLWLWRARGYSLAACSAWASHCSGGL